MRRPELFQFVARRRPRDEAPAHSSAKSIVNGNPLVKDRPTSYAARSGAGAAYRPSTTDPAEGTRQQAQTTWTGEVLRVGPRAEAAARDRHDVSRRPSVAAGHAHAHVRHAADRRGLRPPRPRACFRWRCGAGQRSTRPCGSSRRVPGSGSPMLREKIPNILFQMLLRASNAVGYTNYPDNVVATFVQGSGRRRGSTCSASSTRSTGCRTCAWRWKRCRKHGGICEAAICYTGDILDPKTAKVQPEVLRRSGQGAGEDGRAHPGHQGHGRPVQALRGRSCS